MPDINVAYNWEVSMCNAPNIGYSQAYRQGQTVNGITYYDCSSFQSAALTAAGFFETNPWFTTFSMGQMLDDIRLASECKVPVKFYGKAGGIVPSAHEIIDNVRNFAGGII